MTTPEGQGKDSGKTPPAAPQASSKPQASADPKPVTLVPDENWMDSIAGSAGSGKRVSPEKKR